MDRSSFKQRLVVAACGLLLLPLAAMAADSTHMQTGAWAMHGSSPQVLSRMSVHRTALGTTIDLVQYKRGQHSPISNYNSDEAHPMHLFLLRDDFREFVHMHPPITAGHFRTPIALASGHRYYVYADSDPYGIGQQVYRFQLREGQVPQMMHTPVSASAPTAAVGPYTVRISTTRVASGQRTMLHIFFNKGGNTATDIEPYLGEAAHAVLIDTSDLSFLHVDPARITKGVPSELRLPLPPIGSHAAYKLWLQFKGGGTLYTAPFTIVAK